MFHSDRKRHPYFCGAILAGLLAVFGGSFRPAAGGDPPPKTAVMIPFESMIDPLSGEIFKTKFTAAVDSGVEVVIIDIHSPGGYTHVTFELMDIIAAATQVQTVALIDREAISGAALISLACDRIVMTPDATIGDAGEIVMGADGAFRYTSEKSRSFLAQKIRTTAERTGRSPALAVKMCDKDSVVFGATHTTDRTVRYFSEAQWEALEDTESWTRGKPVFEAMQGKFFTASGRRAVELGVADDLIDRRDQLAALLGVGRPIPVRAWTWNDKAVAVLNTSVVAFLLILLGLLALLLELSSPGIGIGGLLATACFGLFFWSRFLGGTAGWLEVVLFALGLVFVAAEFFVIPGFGFAGLGGCALLVASLVMASRRLLLPEGDWNLAGMGGDLLTVLSAMTAFLVVASILASHIGYIPGLQRLTLSPEVAVSGVPPESREERLPVWQQVSKGDSGVALSPLRPSGKIQCDQGILDVVTEGDFVESGTQVKIIDIHGPRVTVRSNPHP